MSELADKIKEIPIETVLRDYGIPVRRRNQTRGTCRLREADKTPSCTIYFDSNTWYDFGSSRGGSVLNLCMELEHCSAKEAMERMTKRYHVPGWVDYSDPHRQKKPPENEKWLTKTQWESIGITHPAEKMNQLYSDSREIYTAVLEQQAVPEVLRQYHSYLRHLYQDQQAAKRQPQNADIMSAMMRDAYDSYLLSYRNLLRAGAGTDLNVKKMRPDLEKDKADLLEGKKSFWAGGILWQKLKSLDGERTSITVSADLLEIMEELNEEGTTHYCAFQKGDTAAVTMPQSEAPAVNRLLQHAREEQYRRSRLETLWVDAEDVRTLQEELIKGHAALPFEAEIGPDVGTERLPVTVDRDDAPAMQRILDSIHAHQAETHPADIELD